MNPYLLYNKFCVLKTTLQIFYNLLIFCFVLFYVFKFTNILYNQLGDFMRIKNKVLSAFIAVLILASMLGGCSGQKSVDDYAQLTEISMHYTKIGQGKKCVILLHGNGADLNCMNGLAEKLSADYTVYSLDSRCHGKSTDTAEITYDLMAEDVREFIEKMGLEEPYVIGHSDGGIVALTLAIRYPSLLGAIVPCGANSNPNGLVDDFHDSLKGDGNSQGKLVDLMLNYPNFTADDFAKITCPTLVLCGENDLIKQSDSEFITSSINGAKLYTLPGETHTSYILGDGTLAYEKATQFFDSL